MNIETTPVHLEVKWDGEREILSVNGFLISGGFLRAVVADELVPSRPWMVTDRKDGMVFCRSVKLCDCQEKAVAA